MTAILYGRPPAAFAPPSGAVQTSPLIPGSIGLESIEGADAAMIYAPPGALERRYAIALALRALKPGGRFDILAPKDRGGARLKKELQAFGLAFKEEARAHHRRCTGLRPARLDRIDAAIEEGGLRRVEAIDAWSQPGVFAWDRLDPGSALLIGRLPPLRGRGADLGCGWGALAREVLKAPGVEALRLVDVDRRAIEAARRNIDDPRATFEWADARTLGGAELDFVVANPPFHEAGAEDKRLGQAFIQAAAALLRKGGTLWLVANRRLPYEAQLQATFARVRPIADAGGYKVFEATR